ncbi:hypothetical protein [Candidatus Enterococcus mansonii]|uniref:Uncharacterized protein n=1 Tax=Candidatus Enterococcus mansonii TaxID=1834181 RepID=A0A242CEB2_9ENTE|nr:hypothetical protein [Enterococcus sp. 4G2_DIV0659]OTO08499.1 hypothetical protein A5880_001499 [Enterococcus sp. 4G2_DIV0659]
MAIKKIGISINSNAEEIEKQFSKVYSKIKQVKFNKTKFQPNFEKIEKVLDQARGYSGIGNTAKSIQNGADALKNISDKVPEIVGGGPGIIGTGINTVSEVVQLLGEGAKVMEEINSKVPSNLDKLTPKLFNMGVAIAGMGGVVGIVGKLAEKNSEATSAGLETVGGITKLLGEAAESLKQIDAKVPSDLGKLVPKLLNMGVAISGMGLLVIVAGKLSEKNPLAALAGLGVVWGITELLIKSAEALKQINNKVPGNLGKVTAKMLSIGIAIGGMSLIVGVVGALVATGVGALIAGSGLVTVYLVASELMHVAEAISQLDKKVPTNFNKVKQKIKVIAEVIKEFSTLGNPITLVKNIFGSLSTGSVSKTIKIFIDIAKDFENLSKFKIQSVVIKKKIQSIQEVLETIKGSNLIQALNSKFKAFDTAGLANTVSNFVSIGEDFSKLQEVSFDDKVVESNLKKIQEILEIFKGVEFQQIYEHFKEAGDTIVLSEMVGQMLEIATHLSALEEIPLDTEAAKKKLEKIQEVLSVFKGGSWAELFGHGLEAADNWVLTKMIDQLKEISRLLSDFDKQALDEGALASISEKIKKLQEVLRLFDGADWDQLWESIFELADTYVITATIEVLKKTTDKLKILNEAAKDIDFESVGKVILEIQKVLSHLNKSTWQDLLDDAITAGDLWFVSSSMNRIAEIAKSLENTQKTKFSYEVVKKKIEDIQDVVKLLGEGKNFFEKIGSIFSGTFDEAKLMLAVSSMEKIVEIAKSLEILQEITLNRKKIDQNIDYINSAIEKMGQDKLLDFFSKMLKAEDWIDIKNSVDAMIPVMESLNNLVKDKLEDIMINDRITRLNNIIKNLGPDGLKTSFENMLKAEELIEIKKAVEVFIQIIDIFGDINTAAENIDFTAVNTTITDVTEAVKRIGDLESTTDGVDQIKLLIESFAKLMADLKKLEGQFLLIGASYGQQIIEGFNTMEVSASILRQITTLIQSLNNKFVNFLMIGTLWGMSLKGAFNNAIQNLFSSIDTQVANLSEYNSVFTSFGTLLGQSFVDSFAIKIEGISTAVQNQVDKIQSIIDNSSNPVRSAINKAQKTGNYATGGEVAGNRSLSGLSSIFKKKGTDTVPAMLTPGEFVQRRAAVSTFGLDFMNKVNNLDVRGAFSALTGRFNTQSMLIPAVSTVVNNINHTTNNANRVTQNVVGGNADYIMKRASRYLR